MRQILFSLSLLITLSACSQQDNKQAIKEKGNLPSDSLKKYQVAYFGSGCFWCVEAIYESVKGVKEVESGYSGGSVKNPTYEEVCTGKTGHAETVKIYYDSSEVSYAELLAVFFNSHDPTTLNRQGADAGTQYRSAIFYQNEKERDMALAYIKELIDSNAFPIITTEVTPFSSFFKAEAYHQDFECRNPNNGYIKNVSVPRFKQFELKMPEMIKEDKKH